MYWVNGSCYDWFLTKRFFTYFSLAYFINYCCDAPIRGFLFHKPKIYFVIPNDAYQNSLTYLFPICMHSIHYFCHWSSFVDFTLVIVGPNARCAPEQLEQRNTPKFKEAPYLFEIFTCRSNCITISTLLVWRVIV